MKIPMWMKKNCFDYARDNVFALIFLIIVSLLIAAITVILVVDDDKSLSAFHNFMQECIAQENDYRTCLSRYY